MDINAKAQLINYFKNHYSLDEKRIGRAVDELGVIAIISNPTLVGLSEYDSNHFKQAFALCALYTTLKEKEGAL